jgi:hypothetical protein
MRGQFVLKELVAVMFVLCVAAGVCHQGWQASLMLAAVAIPLSGPCLMLWGSIFEHHWMETVGTVATMCAPVLVLVAAILPAIL